MLAIRLQRTGRKGHAMFRIIVQNSHISPARGKVVAFLGSYDPHSKKATLDKEKAAFYLEHGAQPSDRTTRLLQTEGVKLPGWIHIAEGKKGTLRYPDKLRQNRPKDAAPAPTPPPAEEEVEQPTAEAEQVVSEAEAPAVEETASEEESTKANTEETPAETTDQA